MKDDRKSQDQRTIEIIEFARNNSDFYRDYYKSVKAKISSVTDVPVLDTRSFWNTARENISSILTREKINHMVLKSGGSTGIPKRVIYGIEEFEFGHKETAENMVAWGLAAGDRVGNLGFAGDLYATFVYFHDVLRRSPVPVSVYPICAASGLDKMVELILGNEINVLMGTPSLIMKTVETFAEKKAQSLKFPVTKVFFTGEPFFTDQVEVMRAVSPNISICSLAHSSVDVGTIGMATKDCTQFGEHRVFSHESYVEILDFDSGEPIDEMNVPGKLVVTNLNRRLMPVLRYPVGDMVKWIEPKGNANRKYSLMGREPEYWSLASGSFSVQEVVDSLASFKEVQRFQLEITRLNRLDQLKIRIVPKGDDTLVPVEDVKRSLLQGIPTLNAVIKDQEAHPLLVEVVKGTDLVVNDRTGKAIRVVDLRPRS